VICLEEAVPKPTLAVGSQTALVSKLELAGVVRNLSEVHRVAFVSFVSHEASSLYFFGRKSSGR
jgi:hypothetical protein